MDQRSKLNIVLLASHLVIFIVCITLNLPKNKQNELSSNTTSTSTTKEKLRSIDSQVSNYPSTSTSSTQGQEPQYCTGPYYKKKLKDFSETESWSGRVSVLPNNWKLFLNCEPQEGKYYWEFHNILSDEVLTISEANFLGQYITLNYETPTSHLF